MARARKAAETAEAEATAAGKEKREELVAAAKRDIEAETRRSLEQIRKEVADLTVLATEKVTRKSLDADDQRRLVEEAPQRGRLHHPLRVGEQQLMQEVARVYAEALFDVAKEKGKLDAIGEELAQFADAARRRPRDAGLLLQPLLLLGGEDRGPEEGGERRRPGAAQLPRAADREGPHDRDLPHPQSVRAALEAGEQAAST